MRQTPSGTSSAKQCEICQKISRNLYIRKTRKSRKNQHQAGKILPGAVSSFPLVSAYGSRFGSDGKRKNTAELFERKYKEKFLISCEIRNFSLYFIKIIRSYFFVFLLTQTVTHKRKRAERMRQHQVGFFLPGADFCGFFVFFGCTSFGALFGTSHIA